jgi:hypothetical protein
MRGGAKRESGEGAAGLRLVIFVSIDSSWGTNGRSKGKAWEEIIVALSLHLHSPLSLRQLFIYYRVSLPPDLIEAERWKDEAGKPVEVKAVVLFAIDVRFFLIDVSFDQGVVKERAEELWM